MGDLQLLLAEINKIENETDLRSRLSPKLGAYFATKRSGIFFFDRISQIERLFPAGLRDSFSIDRNPVVRYLVEKHAPVRENAVASPRVWTAICPRSDHWHVMAGPIVGNGKLIGVVGCTRERAMSAFNDANIADLSAVCLHLSVWAATVRETKQFQGLKSDRLTSRELEIAALVALGKTNAEIGKELWIAENSVKQALKRMFRKLEVSSRAAMVAKLARE